MMAAPTVPEVGVAPMIDTVVELYREIAVIFPDASYDIFAV